MSFPIVRPRRLRRSENIRSLVRETRLDPASFIQPYFVVPGEGKRMEISSLPGQYQFTVDRLLDEISESKSLGLKCFMLFGVPDYKDEEGSSAWDNNGIIQRTTRAIKEVHPDIQIIADVCFCEYTNHGHCGVLYNPSGSINNQDVHNDRTLSNLAKQVISLAESGVDMMAPSGSIDGMVGTIRNALDGDGFFDLPIMSYAVKYHSSFYGPFRDAVGSAPSFGDRQTYQMDPANSIEALKEAVIDIDEGADIIMVKPALSYLDIIYRVKEISSVPLAAYNVSGEYSLIKFAARQNLIDEKRARYEILTSMKRAGADILITYFAKDMARDLA
ncbi:MAG TPA: porphobilinogen synthase [Oligoflexia bacterium]|nr:porphobilinogen synthase [Oligoflexia bacterium]HMP49049.1 porphobilinogen synthase [Oligoflexia bacterium]